MTTPADKYAEIRDAVRALCAQFPAEYHRKVDAERAYPEAFVDALTQAGWLAAMIPQDYGGSGLGLAEASVIMEEINRSGGNSGACHGQIYNMVNQETNELFFENLEIPAENLIGVEGQGFTYILDGLNAERTLIAAECIGDGYWFIDRVTRYASQRMVFGRAIGQNQGVQF